MKDQTEMNVFHLDGDTITDKMVIRLLELREETHNKPELNYELLEKARQRELEEFPDNHGQINKAYDNAIYYLKLKLAARGLLHGGDNEEPMG